MQSYPGYSSRSEARRVGVSYFRFAHFKYVPTIPSESLAQAKADTTNDTLHK